MGDDANKRHFSRSNSGQKIQITDANEVVTTADLHDVSMNGLLAHCGGTIIAKGEVRVGIRLEPGGDEDLTLEIKGRVRRSDAQGTAIEFLEIDADDVEHLRNLVLYNSADPDRIVDELGVNSGIRPPS